MGSSVKVGIFFTVAVVLLAVMILRVESWNPFGPKGRRIEARFETVVGLDDKSAVRVAGVRVGRVDGIELDSNGRSARVGLQLEKDLTLTEGARARISNQGLLGDKFVELEPGPAGAAPLPEGTVIEGISSIGLDQAMEKIGAVGDSIQQALGGFAGEGGGGFAPLIESLQRTADELRAVIAENRASFGGTVKNFERFSATLAEDLPRIAAQLERMLGQVDSVVAENRGNLKEGLENVKELTDSVQRSVDNLNMITDKIASGEGTVGKLINSNEAHDELIGALKSVESGVDALGKTLNRVDRLRLDVGLESAYLSEPDSARTALRVDLAPRGEESQRLFRFELVADPYGRTSERVDRVTVTGPGDQSETITTTRLTAERRRSEYSMMVGFPFAERRGLVWTGLIENTGGVAVDYGIVRDKLGLRFEAYDFSRDLDLDPHLRVTANWFPFKNVYVTAGYDDALIDELATPFVGAGIRWSDEDLKFLIGSIPKF